MKKITKPLSIFLLAITTFALGAGLVSSVSAQESSTGNILLQKLDALVEQLATLSSKDATTPSQSEDSQLLIAPTGGKNPSCLDNYQSWPTSTTRKEDAPWSLKDFDIGYLRQSMTDLN